MTQLYYLEFKNDLIFLLTLSLTKTKIALCCYLVQFVMAHCTLMTVLFSCTICDFSQKIVVAEGTTFEKSQRGYS